MCCLKTVLHVPCVICIGFMFLSVLYYASELSVYFMFG